MFDVVLAVLPLLIHAIIGQLEEIDGNLEAQSPLIVTAPNLTGEFSCGYPHALAKYYGDLNGEKVHIYHLNKTVEKLISEGYNVTINNKINDAVSSFTYLNGSSPVTVKYEGYGGLAAVGGRPAKRTRAYYMAQLGMKRGKNIRWLCDGILINRRWVLSAAHCFVDVKYTPNLIRLGDYDVSVPPDETTDVFGKFIEDYYIKSVKIHPNYTGEEWYHDLALLPLSRPTPSKSHSINPICLPWGPEMELLGKQVTLTGWGATVFGGSKTSLLQEVDLEVFETSVCNSSYNQIDNFKQKYPNGLTEKETLCAGWKEGGKDACGGDSGAPLVLDEIDGKTSITLIGVVSSGYGCGQKDFPGLYIPISHHGYLQWIKDVAFKDYE